MALRLVATCALGLEELLAKELAALDVEGIEPQRGAVAFQGSWKSCWRANWRLRTANRILVELARFPAANGDELTRGARRLITQRSRQGVDIGRLLQPDRTFSIRATTSQSKITDVRWAALKLKDGLVDGQRDRYRRRSSIDRQSADLPLRLRLHRDQAILTLDTSGEPLDHRGYRVESNSAPVRENLAAACVLASGWDGTGPVVDPMCGSGTLLAEAASFALSWAPNKLRYHWAFERLPSFDAAAFGRITRHMPEAPGPDVRLFGNDISASAVRATRRNMAKANLSNRLEMAQMDAYDYRPPATPGLILVNPAYGERLDEAPDQWKRLGDLFKQQYKGWRAVVLAGDSSRGKHIGLKPKRRIPVMNGPLEARILVFDLY